MAMDSTDAKVHFGQARTALINSKNATTAADRQAWATLARSEIELVRIYMMWPTDTYGTLP